MLRNIIRYERATVLSHRAALENFLAGPDSFCCVLEDDVFLSPDFPRFINSETWIPKGCDLVKIETCAPEFNMSCKTVACLDRQAALLYSLHFGTAGYIIGRRCAQIFLAESARPNRTVDRIMFDEAGLRKLRPVYQLIPALCIQANQRKDGILFPELDSSHQRPFAPAAQPQSSRQKKRWLVKSNGN